MANLVSNDYYKNTWLGTVASSETDLTKMLSRAEDIIRMEATRSIDTNPVSDWVKKAICAQAEQLINGAYDIMIGASGDVTSASLGEYSYDVKDTGSNSFKDAVVSKMALEYLRAGGFRSAVVYGCRRF